jgi:hypothetical protein
MTDEQRGLIEDSIRQIESRAGIVWTAEFLEDYAAALRALLAELAALKANDPLAEMWRELSEYQPQADRDGHGESWKRMCEERTEETANAAAWARGASVLASHAANAASWAVARRRSSDGSASNALALIRQAKEAKP